MTKKEELINLMFDTRRLIWEQIRTKRSERFDPISFLRFKVLRYVERQGQPTMREVANFLTITPASTTSLITKMIESKLLKRQSDKTDRRIVRLVLTPSGKKMIGQKRRLVIARMRAVFSQLNRQDINNLYNIFYKLKKVYQTSNHA